MRRVASHRGFESPPAIQFAPVDFSGMPSLAARGINNHDHEENTWVHPLTRQRICWHCHPPPTEVTTNFTGERERVSLFPIPLLETIDKETVVLLRWTPPEKGKK